MSLPRVRRTAQRRSAKTSQMRARTAFLGRVYRSGPASGAYTGTLLQRTPATGFPERLNVKLRYSFFRAFTQGATGQDVYQFKVNSVYDPDSTAAGHQPLYRDQLYLIYKYAVVTSCDYMIQATTNSTSGIIVFATATTYATVDTDSSAAQERGQHDIKLLTVSSPVTLRGSIGMSQIFGVDKEAIISDDLYRHDSAADPSQLCYLSVYTQDMESAGFRVLTNVNLDMMVTFSQVLKIAQS